MLLKKYRLAGRIEADFFMLAKKKQLPMARLYYMKDESLENSQMAIIASKKNFRLSVTRHQLKRKLRASMSSYLLVWPKGKYVWFLKPLMLKMSVAELEKYWQKMAINDF